jgi:hypothetical protein
MADSLNDLYLKIASEIEPALEEDGYFQYLYELIQSGETTIDQKTQIMHKIVDEEWLQVTEDTIDSIYKIISAPRKFIKRSEEIVPVDLAKKITAESVRHLSMNTQFIQATDDDDVHPTRVLNVTNEETYDLYENRFIFHLILRLIAFIDKRTDIIFWSTGDEIRNNFTLESSFEDDFEDIKYKLEISILDRKSMAQSQSDNMDIFMRIDRIRRLVLGLRSSFFYEVMYGCNKVKSPIQRTNLLVKDPDYRKCYALWKFLDRYEGVGYTIQTENRALAMDEEYQIQVFTNMITNYTVFKSLLAEDGRAPSELLKRRFRQRKPRFIRTVSELPAAAKDVEDVEVRRVFVEEVTKAQLEAEAERDRMREMMVIAQASAAESDRLREEALKKRDEAMELVNETKLKARDAINGARVAVAEAFGTAREAAEQAFADAAVEIEFVKHDEKERADRRIAAAEADRDTKVAEARADRDARVAAAEADRDSKVAAAEKDRDDKVSAAEADRDEKVAAAQTDRDTKVAAAEAAAAERISAADASKAEADEARARAEKFIEESRVQLEVAVSRAKARVEQAEKDIASAAQRESEALEATTRAKAAEAEATGKNAELDRLLAEAAQTKASADDMLRSVKEEKAAAMLSISEAKKAVSESEAAAAAERKASAERLTRAESIMRSAESRYNSAAKSLDQSNKRMAEAQRIRDNAAALVSAAEKERSTMERRLQQMQERLDKEIRAREKAEKRLREGSFSQSLAKALFGRQTPPENGENGPGEE